MEACVHGLVVNTSNSGLEDWGSSLACHLVSSNMELFFTPLSLSSPRCINGCRQHTAGGGGGGGGVGG